jgi:nucleotide-binding universal stress UspA family protein
MFRSILVAWDGSAHAERALAEAIDIAHTQGARLTLLTVAAPVRVWAGPYVPTVTEDELVQAAEKIVAEGEALVPDDVPHDARTAAGHAGVELLGRAAAANHDLIVMGSRGRGAIKSAVLGSVSHYVLNHSDVPVLITHDGTHAEPETE